MISQDTAISQNEWQVRYEQGKIYRISSIPTEAHTFENQCRLATLKAGKYDFTSKWWKFTSPEPLNVFSEPRITWALEFRDVTKYDKPYTGICTTAVGQTSQTFSGIWLNYSGDIIDKMGVQWAELNTQVAANSPNKAAGFYPTGPNPFDQFTYLEELARDMNSNITIKGEDIMGDKARIIEQLDLANTSAGNPICLDTSTESDDLPRIIIGRPLRESTPIEISPIGTDQDTTVSTVYTTNFGDSFNVTHFFANITTVPETDVEPDTTNEPEGITLDSGDDYAEVAYDVVDSEEGWSVRDYDPSKDSFLVPDHDSEEESFDESTAKESSDSEIDDSSKIESFQTPKRMTSATNITKGLRSKRSPPPQELPKPKRKVLNKRRILESDSDTD